MTRPSVHPSSPASPRLAFRVGLLRGLTGVEPGLCFAIEGSPPGGGRSVPLSGGGIRLTHELEGRVVCVGAGHIDIGSGYGLVRLRHVLPPAIALEPLLGHAITITSGQLVGVTSGFDLRIRGADGGLLLWAYDGPLPIADGVFGVRWVDSTGGLAVNAAAEAPRLAPRQLGWVELDGERRRFLTLAADPEHAAFVVLG